MRNGSASALRLRALLPVLRSRKPIGSAWHLPRIEPQALKHCPPFREAAPSLGTCSCYFYCCFSLLSLVFSVFSDLKCCVLLVYYHFHESLPKTAAAEQTAKILGCSKDSVLKALSETDSETKVWLSPAPTRHATPRPPALCVLLARALAPASPTPSFSPCSMHFAGAFVQFRMC